jgi:FemAB-related protein (PEP-CTERM system-associated)
MEPADAPAWDRFVRAHPRGSPFHLIAWRRCIEQTFAYRPIYLVAERANQWGGILPLFECQGWFSGKAWISTPFAVYGGALFLDAGAAAALREALVQRAREAAVQYADLRNGWEDQCLGFHRIRRYATFTLPLSPLPQEEFLATLPKKTRNMVRKALKTPFTSRRDSRDAAGFAEFHARTLRRLGTPSFPAAHFQRILDHFGPEAGLFELFHEDQLAAACLSFFCAGSAHIYYAGADPRFNHLAANYAMYHECLMDAARRGFTHFDFGRAKPGGGTFEFKRHWGAEMRELPYEMLLVRRRSLPDLTPRNPKFSLAIAAWRRLPFWLTRRLGPLLIRQFP